MSNTKIQTPVDEVSADEVSAGEVNGEVTSDRRSFVMTSLAAGFALAVRPIVAQTVITTDSNGLMAGEVKIPVKDAAKEIPAYHAMPMTGSNFPVVLVVQEVFGVHEHIKDMCRRFAKQGYLAVAPALYARQGDPSNLELPEVLKLAAKVPDSQVMSDLDASVAWAKKQKGNTNRVAITGFCWGGRIVYLYSAHNPNVKAGAAWYGRIEGDKTAMTPGHPIDIVAQIKAPIIGFYGGQDMGIPVASAEKMRDAMKAAGKTMDLNVYPQAQHGFNADYRPSYNKEAATDAWSKLLAWFKKYDA